MNEHKWSYNDRINNVTGYNVQSCIWKQFVDQRDQRIKAIIIKAKWWAKHRHIIFEFNTDMQVISGQTTHLPLSVMNNKVQHQWAHQYEDIRSMCLVVQSSPIQVCFTSCYCMNSNLAQTTLIHCVHLFNQCTPVLALWCCGECFLGTDWCHHYLVKNIWITMKYSEGHFQHVDAPHHTTPHHKAHIAYFPGTTFHCFSSLHGLLI